MNIPLQYFILLSNQSFKLLVILAFIVSYEYSFQYFILLSNQSFKLLVILARISILYLLDKIFFQFIFGYFSISIRINGFENIFLLWTIRKFHQLNVKI